MHDDLKTLLDFFHLCEKLKIEKRHGKTSDGENDRVAAHSWRMAVMIMFLKPLLKSNLDIAKALKLTLIHDLGEVITGDIAYFHTMFNQEERLKKDQRDDMAMEKIADMLFSDNRAELLTLWQEYNEQITYESKVVKAVDKLEAHMQHNEADISVWNEYDRNHYKTFIDKYCDFDPTLKILKELIRDESTQKLR